MKQLLPSPRASLATAVLLCAIIILSTQTHANSLQRSQVQNFNPGTRLSSLTDRQRQDNDDSNGSGVTFTVGIIVGITIGAVVLVLLIVLIVFFLTRRCAPKREDGTHYQGFADWRKDRNLTSMEIERGRRNNAPNNDADVNVASREHGITHV